MKLLSHGLTLFNRRVLPTIISRPFILQNYSKLNKSFLLNKTEHALISIQQIHTSQKKEGPKTPDLIYVPHVLRWLKTKFRLKYLQKTWDPEFSEGAFIYGTTQAVCRITEIINSDKPEQLEGLLTNSAKIKLQEDMASRITKLQKQIIKLRPDDIKILVPIAVNMITEGFTKKCKVSLRSLALKWFDDGGSLKLVLVALQTEFIRDYTHGTDSDWTISIFDILECAMLSESSTAH